MLESIDDCIQISKIISKRQIHASSNAIEIEATSSPATIPIMKSVKDVPNLPANDKRDEIINMIVHNKISIIIGHVNDPDR